MLANYRQCAGFTCYISPPPEHPLVLRLSVKWGSQKSVPREVCAGRLRQNRPASMSGVWVFKGAVSSRLVPNPLQECVNGVELAGLRRKVLVYRATNETVESYEVLEEKFLQLGWIPYDDGDKGLRQYHISYCTPHLISLPLEFANLKPRHMYDIVVKTRSAFEVRDA